MDPQNNHDTHGYVCLVSQIYFSFICKCMANSYSIWNPIGNSMTYDIYEGDYDSFNDTVMMMDIILRTLTRNYKTLNRTCIKYAEITTGVKI